MFFESIAAARHGKVAVSDDEWASVGSSNLDPLSLSLNLEANVIIKGPRLQPAFKRAAGRADPAQLQTVSSQTFTKFRDNVLFVLPIFYGRHLHAFNA